jgi:hypothetical protein
LCCADEDVLEVSSVFENLKTLGCTLELVTGVELDVSLLTGAVDRMGTSGLWVLCRSESLDHFQIDRLKQVLARCDVSQEMICVVDFGSEDLGIVVRGLARRVGIETPVNPSPVSTVGVAANDEPVDGAMSFQNPITRVSTAAYQRVRGAPRWALASGLGAIGLMLVGGLALSCGPSEAERNEEANASALAAKTAVQGESAEATQRAPEAKDASPAAGDLAANPSAPVAGAPAGTLSAPIAAPKAAEDAGVPDPDGAPEEPTLGDDDLMVGQGGGDEEGAIVAALRSRQIRSLDILLIAPKRTKRLNFEKAVAYCEASEAGQLGQWRLPTIGEMRTLTEGAVIPKDLYWSSTSGDTFGDKKLVWNGRRRKIVGKSKRWRGARAACVRTRDGAPSSE